MTIFNFLSLIGGIALFLYGMSAMGDGLSKVAGGKMESILEHLTSTPFKGVLLGAVVTAVIQSSAATTVMVIGFVNSGIMKLTQGIGIIMGANIGTTITAWILALSGIQGESVILQLLKPSSFSPVVAFIGIVMMMFAKSDRKKDVGQILLGFSVLMYGMTAMSDAASPLSEMPEFSQFILKLNNPILGIIIGIVLTVVVQSSSASIGILEVLAMTGVINYWTAIPVILGENIGGCSTAMISSIGAKAKAKRAAFVHLYFNVIGTIIFVLVFYTINLFHPFAFLNSTASTWGIAIFHTSFNVATMLILLPVNGLLEKLAELTIKDDEDEVDREMEGYTAELRMLDERFLEQPAFAVAQCITVSDRMAELTEKCLKNALDLFNVYDKKKAAKVTALESAIDTYEDRLGTYLVKLGGKNLTVSDSEKVTRILQSITNFERISDHALNIAEIAGQMNKKELTFSSKGKDELDVYTAAVREIVSTTVTAYRENDLSAAKKVEPLEEVIDGLNDKARKRHVKRLQKGKCTIELGVLLEDILINLERVSDHCSNVAVTMIQVDDDMLDAHSYVGNLREENTPEFESMYKMYSEKYNF